MGMLTAVPSAPVRSAIALLYEALDELAAEDVTGASLRDDLLELERARARLDAETSRRLREFDRSCEWAISGVWSAAGFLCSRPCTARGEAHHRVRVAREVDNLLDATAVGVAAGAVTTRHVEAIRRTRHAAHADREFTEFEPLLVETAAPGTPEDVANVARQWRDAADADLDRARRTNLPSVLIVTDKPTLTGDAVGECRLASGSRISPETARRVMCDAQVQEVRTDGGVVLDMGRATRTFTPDQFRAMVVRDAHASRPRQAHPQTSTPLVAAA